MIIKLLVWLRGLALRNNLRNPYLRKIIKTVPYYNYFSQVERTTSPSEGVSQQHPLTHGLFVSGCSQKHTARLSLWQNDTVRKLIQSNINIFINHYQYLRYRYYHIFRNDRLPLLTSNLIFLPEPKLNSVFKNQKNFKSLVSLTLMLKLKKIK